MELAVGLVLEDLVLELAQQNARMQEHELLVILDALLDLLETAHKHEIVYNDVDAKHLFWDREAYQLKVIDWGNAVFLEGDEATPQGVSRQSDIFQVGELLYFVLTGGQRLLLVGENVDFGEDAGHIPTRLQGIVQRAVHPALERRYPDIAALRRDLDEYRRPLDRERASAIERIERRLKRECSQRELEHLLGEVQAVQTRDPGYPPLRELRRQIEAELHRLTILSDLDAARIYLEGANWLRAITLLEDIVERAAGPERSRAQILLAASRMAQHGGLQPPPAGFPPAFEALFAGENVQAAHALLVTPEARDAARTAQWLLAERIQAQLEGVIVLRPHLLRLRLELPILGQRYDVRVVLEDLDEAEAALDVAGGGRLEQVAAAYQKVGEALQGASRRLAELPQEANTPLARVAQRGGEAAYAVVEQLRAAGQQATGNKTAAREALDAAEALDPVNLVFSNLRETMTGLQEFVRRLSEHRPLADGSDLRDWFGQALLTLKPYLGEVPDPRLPMLIGNLEEARDYWAQFQAMVIEGNRLEAVEGLRRAAEAIRKLNPELANWIKNVLGVVEKARYVQRHALNTAFGRAMAEGWMAWDRGSGIEAERLGRQALEEVTSDAEQEAADRLIRIGKLLRTWTEGHGEGNPELTAGLDAELLGLLTEAEERRWRMFTEQMPSPAAYLKSMGPGLIEPFEATSIVGQRVLFFHYVLRGVLDMYERRVEDAEFWKLAAEQAMPNAQRHIAYLALNNLLRDRQVIVTHADQINAIETVADLATVRRKIEASTLHLLLRPVTEALQATETALPLWQRGDFRAVGRLLEEGLGKLDTGEKLAHLDLSRFRAWLERLHRTAAELEVARSRIAEVGANPQDPPDLRWSDWHDKLVDDTTLFLGETYAHDLAYWRDTYRQMLTIYTEDARRRTRKLREFDEILNRSGIGQHPAHGLFRFWRETVDARPEFPAPPTSEPTPRYAELGDPVIADYALEDDAPGGLGPFLSSARGRMLILAAALLVVLAGGLLLVANGNLPGLGGEIAVTWATFTPTLSSPAARAATAGAAQTAAAVAALTSSPTPTATVQPSDTPTPTLTPTETVIPSLDPGSNLLPTALVPPTATATVTSTPTLTPTPSQTPEVLPSVTPEPPTATPAVAQIATADGPVRGTQNVLLALEQAVAVYPWPETWFQPGDVAGEWLLGMRQATAGPDLLQITLPPDLLAQMFGPDAAICLRRLEVTLSLRDYDPALLAAGQVYFGLGLQGADESSVAVQAQLVRADAINIGARVGDEFRARMTVPINDGRVVLALERLDDGNVVLEMGDQPVGSPRFLTAPNAPVMPYLFVPQGGVVVAVTDLVAVLD